MIHLIKRVFTIVLFVSSIQAQHIPTGLDSVLNKTLDSMRLVLQVKSLSAAIQCPDEAIWAGAKGISSENPNVNVEVNDVYLIGSVTKTITSACILKLHEQKLLNIDDPISNYLDTITYIDPKITIRQLLQHTSGIYDVLSNPALQPILINNLDSIWNYEPLIKNFIKAPLFLAGSRWSYSNTNYFLLGMIIKKVTGNEYYQELRKLIYDPINLKSISIPAYEPLNNNVAHVWLDITGDGIADDAHDFYINYLSLNSVAGSAGGYFSTASDITKWMRTYMRGDFLSSSTLDEAKKTVPASGSQGGAYGLGLMKNSFNGFLAYGHGGDLGYAASSWYFPEKDISISVLTNDSKNNSWTLLPVVSALLKTYNNWKSAVSTNSVSKPDFEINTFPNPIEDKLNISIHLTSPVNQIDLVLCNSLGEKISSIHDGQVLAGTHQWNFKDLSLLSEGFYYLNVVIDSKESSTFKIFK